MSDLDVNSPQAVDESERSVAQQGRALYAWMDREFDRLSGGDTGFEALLRVGTPAMDDAAVEGFRKRHALIGSFHRSAMSIFTSSLRGQADPRFAEMVLGDVPAAFGADYHRGLSDEQLRTPLFYRTDEPLPGKLSEVQCSGSAWDLAELLWDLAEAHPGSFGPRRHFDRSPAEAVAGAMRSYLEAEPVVHHLLDNASRPHGMRYFLQRTRAHGVRYYSYDAGVRASDCNLVRSHDFYSLLHHNFFAERMRRCAAGEIHFDLPPAALFDGKLIMAWPFWAPTRDAFSDAERDLFPYTVVVEPDGMEMESGERIALEAFLALPTRDRAFYLKYGGTDVALNWGSQAVYLASKLSRPQAEQLALRIREDHARGRYWVAQAMVTEKEDLHYWTREGEQVEAAVNSKWSGFYGPDGLLSILGFNRPFHKVHGSANTVMGLVR